MNGTQEFQECGTNPSLTPGYSRNPIWAAFFHTVGRVSLTHLNVFVKNKSFIFIMNLGII